MKKSLILNLSWKKRNILLKKLRMSPKEKKQKIIGKNEKKTSLIT